MGHDYSYKQKQAVNTGLLHQISNDSVTQSPKEWKLGMQCQANRVVGIEDRLFAANMQSSSDKNGPKMKYWAGVWGIFCLGVALWTHGHGEP